MGALKMIGYLLVAVLLLTVVVGGAMFVAAIVAFGGAVICVVGLVWAVASTIKHLVEGAR